MYTRKLGEAAKCVIGLVVVVVSRMALRYQFEHSLDGKIGDIE